MKAAKENTALGRNPGIDILRGVSIVLVVMHHVGLRIPLKRGVLATLLPKWSLDALIYNGYEAVFVFFVISGFLITSNTLARWGRLGAIDVRAFYVRRGARILPCLLILVAVLAVLHFAGAADYVIHRPKQSLQGAIASALGLQLNWYEGRTGYLPASWDVLWSLSIEEVFYLAFPLLCVSLRKNWILMTALGGLALSLPASRAALAGNEIWQEKAYLPGMAAIAAGVIGALMATRFRGQRRGVMLSVGVVGAVGLIAVLCCEGKLWRWLGNGTMLVLTGATVCVLLAFDGWGRGRDGWTIPGTGWLRSFGRLSYEIYLTHMFVVMTVISIFKRNGAEMRWGILWYAPSLILSWGLGWVVARYVSVPAERAVRERVMQTSVVRVAARVG